MQVGSGPLPGPLRKYEKVITDIIWELGVKGKADEFVQEGKVAVYRVAHELYSTNNEVAKDTVVYRSVKEHLLKFIVAHN